MQIGGPKPDGPSGTRKGVDGARNRGEASGLRSLLGLGEGTEPAAPGAPAESPAQVSLSGAVDDVRRVADLARQEPDFRPDVVEQARRDLEDGLLTADPHALAELISRDP